ncbi:MAG: hypothetical protein M1827_002493 [Pycnora praestabilis]|nr:MAG: hypothetical protein M1827_002493 [Pycnora praestabilis]
MTNILLITSLISLLSASLAKVMNHAREEYLFIYSVFVLENLISLVLRPLRLLIPSEQVRNTRVVLLKLTHFPYVAIIWAYESGYQHLALLRSSSRAPAFSPKGVNRSLTDKPRLPLSALNRRSSRRGRPRDPSEPQKHDLRRSLLEVSEASDLQASVQKLSLQVEELTAMLAQQRNH